MRCNSIIASNRTVVVVNSHPRVVVVVLPQQASSSYRSNGSVNVLFSTAVVSKQKRMITTIPFHARRFDSRCRCCLLQNSITSIGSFNNTCSSHNKIRRRRLTNDHKQLSGRDDEKQKQQPIMSYYERTVTFSNSIYKLYQDYLLYQNITSAYQTATAATSTGHTSSHHHAWAQRYQVLCDMSRRSHRHNYTSIIESAVALIVQQQYSNTYQYAPNLVIPYCGQEQQYQFLSAIGKVTPIVLLCMIPIVGYVPMLLAILLPRQLLCYHFYNHDEILHYNDLQYQQRKRYYYYYIGSSNDDDSRHNTTNNAILTNIRRILEKYQQQQHQKSMLSSSSSSSNLTSADDIISFYRDCASMNDDEASTKKDDTWTKTTTITNMYNILQLRTYPRDTLIQLALATGMYSSTITNRIIQYYIVAYCIPTFVLRYHIRSLAKHILRNDQLLLCEEYLATTSLSYSSSKKIASSFVQTNMTDVELSNACLLRGIPTTSQHSTSLNPHDQICHSLMEHLNIVASLLQITHTQKLKMRSSPSNEKDQGDAHLPLATTAITDPDMEQIGLFMLHVPLIRGYISKQYNEKRNAACSFSKSYSF